MNRLTNAPIVAMRLAIGIAQGAALWWIQDLAGRQQSFKSDSAMLTALWATALFVPTLAVMAIGNVRRRVLLTWLGIAAGLCFSLGFHAGHQYISGRYLFDWWAQNVLFDSALAGLLFVGHALVSAGDADRRWIARFPTYFDVSWRQATVLGLAGLFVGVFWGVLALGGMLFGAIGIRRFGDTLTEHWFWIPATAAAGAMAIHLIDLRTNMIRGARTLVLGMLAWLMPLLVAIGLAFLITLPFTGLQPLWDTRRATSVALSAAIVLVLLINSHFQAGTPDSHKPLLLVVARAIAAIMLSPLTLLAGYGLALRVDQYGWSPSRVVSAAIIIGVACHAVGYLYAVLRSRTALAQLPVTNIVSALIVLSMMIGLLSPIADPARLSVDSQVHRLVSGAIPPRQFDYTFLAKASGRYGLDALDKLKRAAGSPLAEQIADRARTAPRAEPRPRKTPAEVITVVNPAGQTLPASFLERDWTGTPAPACLKTGDAQCQAVLLDLDGDGRLDVLLIDGSYTSRVAAFRESAGTWAYWGNLNGSHCSGVDEALRSGRFELVPTTARDVIANGYRLRVTPPCADLP